MEKLPLYPHLLDLAIEILEARNEMHDKYPTQYEMEKAQYLAGGFSKIIDRERSKYPDIKSEDQIIEVIDYMKQNCSVRFSEDFFKWFMYTFQALIVISSFGFKAKSDTRAFELIKRINSVTKEKLEDSESD